MLDCDGAVGDGEPDTEAVAGGVPSLGAAAWLWCEVATVAMPALAPAMANTLSAASTGVQPRRSGSSPEDPRRERGSRPGLAGHPERDILHGHPARRLGGDPVQHLRQLPFLGVHEATPPVMSSASPGASRSRASAFDACAFTAPTEQPIAAAVCASV